MPQLLSETSAARTVGTPSDENIREAARAVLAEFAPPSSVYRLQLSPSFGFDRAAGLAPYLRALGTGALYLSPCFQAVPGSPHGYDVTDPNVFNPELGGEDGHARLCLRLREAGLRQVIDVVPNHMGIASEGNRFWNDVLENGPGSLYASFFDIDWEPVKRELKNKVLLPVLPDFYGRVLERGEIALAYADGEFSVRAAGRRLPLSPSSYPSVLEPGPEGQPAGLSRGDADSLEYLSVITAFRNLPGNAGLDADRLAELHREKEIAKQRLGALTARSAAVRRFVESRVAFFNGRKGHPSSYDALDALLSRQAYRLAHWRVASEEINYRRFFTINELAAVRMEDPPVFEHCHRLVFRLLAEGRVHGLRVDHPDGLYDPPGYFSRLQTGYLARATARRLEAGEELRERILAVLAEKEFRSSQPLYVVAEKVLDRRESLPADWRVHGTVGYDFLNALNGLFVRCESAAAFDALYEAFIRHRIDLNELVYDTKNSFAAEFMASEVDSLGCRLDRISEGNRRYRDFTRGNLTLAIQAVIDAFPVYRTYVPPSGGVSARDEAIIRRAVERARKRTPRLDPAIFDFIRDVLLLRLEEEVGPEEAAAYRDFVMRFQQLTAPVMAKGLEDTAFYVNNRLSSLNEVGGDPRHFGVTPEEFHAQNRERAARWPHTFLTTSTHDTKRSQDARMRLNVLSEIPAEWERAVGRWAEWNESLKTAVDGVPSPRRNTEYFIYQTLVAAWPDGKTDGAAREAFRGRFWDNILKSVREAKIYTNWTDPNGPYETAVEKFVRGLFDPAGAFLPDFLEFQARVSRCGKENSLSALALKLGSPGVADTYQGEELWRYDLVDPDNRLPVDFDACARALESVRAETAAGPLEAAVRRMAASPEDGRLKLHLLRTGLALRRENPALFTAGDYEPVAVEGERAGHAVAFLRREGSKTAFVAVARFFAEGFPETPAAWADTRFVLPRPPAAPFTDAFTGRPCRAEGRTLRASDVFGVLRTAMLVDFPAEAR
ncbi:MAG TPA: malto-oligosyltrehalose synthase [Candidatus Eisenbacteria bacterium]|nr:malto-oligosyltrehalose synthase [Candidatus Eisenbacteria bacterium]